MLAAESIIPDHATRNSARAWLKLSVWALALAGFFSVLIVFARTPAFSNIEALKDFFHIALVVHVDLSVLVWFLAIAGMLFALMRDGPVPYLGCAAFWAMAAGTGLIALSPFTGQGAPLMSNYIPVLTNGAFFLGLALVLTGALLSALSVLISPAAKALSFRRLFSKRADFTEVQDYGIASAGAILLLALACFYWTAQGLPLGRAANGGMTQDDYELLFWGGGHVMQFMDTQLMMTAWVLLALTLGLPLRLRPSTLAILYSFGLLAALTAPLAYFRYGVESSEHKLFFTHLMIVANGLAPVGLFGAIFAALISLRQVPQERRALWSALWMSLILFAFGGVLGLSIQGQNVTIPAHYHGSIVGVTLAFMGLAYALLPRLGYPSIAQTRLAFWQPVIYGGGQLIHISALAWSGGYGVLRKTPGALEPGMNAAKIAMGIMGIGGLVAIIGGLMFVVAMWRGMRRGECKEEELKNRRIEELKN